MKIDERHNIIIFEENDYDVDGYTNFSRKIKKFKDANPQAEDLLVLVDFKELEKSPDMDGYLETLRQNSYLYGYDSPNENGNVVCPVCCGNRFEEVRKTYVSGSFGYRNENTNEINPIVFITDENDKEENLECKVYCVHCGEEFEFPVV